MKEIIELIGKDKYVELLKKYNLCTKKWTYGRTKELYIELEKLIKLKTKELKDGKIESSIN